MYVKTSRHLHPFLVTLFLFLYMMNITTLSYWVQIRAFFESECLELCPKAFRSFLVIIPMVELLAVMVNRKNLTDAGLQAKILPAGAPRKWRASKHGHWSLARNLAVDLVLKLQKDPKTGAQTDF